MDFHPKQKVNNHMMKILPQKKFEQTTKRIVSGEKKCEIEKKLNE